LIGAGPPPPIVNRALKIHYVCREEENKELPRYNIMENNKRISSLISMQYEISKKCVTNGFLYIHNSFNAY
jgi:hypothetical protein